MKWFTVLILATSAAAQGFGKAGAAPSGDASGLLAKFGGAKGGAKGGAPGAGGMAGGHAHGAGGAKGGAPGGGSGGSPDLSALLAKFGKGT